ncbi:prolipoprotein diacylglyceryl transferase family protein [Actinoplanes solisilvae]|uniref:prolipoprotein diacylglyceryl transferase family protein n=1 Tax=Actinoplanes solisilvae TaxID=2486853 RepID=UPI000FDBF8CB|nr:prolipoprotein diacylglyceryl transferase family protein [Actinoplanes solisilvae]
MSDINDRLDRLPRDTIHLTGTESPAFRAIGVAGFHAALATMLGGALLRGLPLTVAVVVALTAAVSFFAWALPRRLLTGRESLVLLEHVWFTGACVLAALSLLGEPWLPWLDVLAVALAVFLAAGRVGCAVAGCCHGHPAGVGIRYPDGHPEPRVAGRRLFPVQLLECAGLLTIAVTGTAALPFAAPGAILVWALAAYAILRFGTEALRGDPRPHVLGVPVARFAAGLQLAAALIIDTLRSPAPHDWQPAVLTVAALAAAGLLGLPRYHRRPAIVTGPPDPALPPSDATRFTLPAWVDSDDTTD